MKIYYNFVMTIIVKTLLIISNRYNFNKKSNQLYFGDIKPYYTTYWSKFCNFDVAIVGAVITNNFFKIRH